jgi:hypothetical protein
MILTFLHKVVVVVVVVVCVVMFLFVCVFVCLFVCLSVCLFVCVCLFVLFVLHIMSLRLALLCALSSVHVLCCGIFYFSLLKVRLLVSMVC